MIINAMIKMKLWQDRVSQGGQDSLLIGGDI
jgi:hypothetical protein